MVSRFTPKTVCSKVPVEMCAPAQCAFRVRSNMILNSMMLTAMIYLIRNQTLRNVMTRQ